jgi:hypothetical protein
MRAKPWFRVHTSILTSRKAQLLPPMLFKWLVNFWAATAANDGVLPSAEDLSWTLHCKPTAVQTAIRELTEKHFLDEAGGVIKPHDWAEWQYESDNSTERVKKHRAEKKSLNSPGPGDVAIEPDAAAPSPPDADLWAESVCDRHPKVTDRILALHVLSELAGSPDFDRDAFDKVHLAWCATGEWQEKNGRFAPKLAAWILDRGYERLPGAANGADPAPTLSRFVDRC